MHNNEMPQAANGATAPQGFLGDYLGNAGNGGAFASPITGRRQGRI